MDEIGPAAPSCEASFAFECLNIAEAIVTIASTLTVTLIIILGNALVVLTVYLDDKLRRQRQNWLIVSLAVADLLVGLLVMPLTLLYEVLGRWTLGVVLCEMWLALDVLFVTASILHICAISLDRYWSVTQPLSYPARRTPSRMMLMIGTSWLVSLLISLPPVFGWRPENRGQSDCVLSTDKSYVLYSSLGSFYIPVIILVAVYAKIYSITIEHSRNRLQETKRLDQTLKAHTKGNGSIERVELEIIDDSSDPPDSGRKTKKSPIAQVCWHLRRSSEDAVKSHEQNGNKMVMMEVSSGRSEGHGARPSSPAATTPLRAAPDGCCETTAVLPASAMTRRRKLKAKERQATMLLGLILSAFILSWLPFFVMYVSGAFGVEAPQLIFKFFFWLGYCNSGINPVIYTVFNREFKRALCGQLRRLSRLVRPLLLE